MAPEQRDDERRAARTARLGLRGRGGVEQERREPRQSDVRRLVQRGPAVRVCAGGVGAALEQQPHGALVAGGAGHVEEVVAVGAASRDEIGEAVELLAQRVEVARLDGAVGAGERLAAVPSQVRDVPAQSGP
jgi:hypothetical protein